MGLFPMSAIQWNFNYYVLSPYILQHGSKAVSVTCEPLAQTTTLFLDQCVLNHIVGTGNNLSSSFLSSCSHNCMKHYIHVSCWLFWLACQNHQHLSLIWNIILISTKMSAYIFEFWEHIQLGTILYCVFDIYAIIYIYKKPQRIKKLFFFQMCL